MLMVLLSFMCLLSYAIAIVADGDDFVDHPNTSSLSGTYINGFGIGKWMVQ